MQEGVDGVNLPKSIHGVPGGVIRRASSFDNNPNTTNSDSSETEFNDSRAETSDAPAVLVVVSVGSASSLLNSFPLLITDNALFLALDFGDT